MNQPRLESSRLLVSIFYSNPEKLEVYWNRRRVLPLEHHLPSSNSYNFSMRKPTINDPCALPPPSPLLIPHRACDLAPLPMWTCAPTGVEERACRIGKQILRHAVWRHPQFGIKTVKKVVLSLGIELPTEDFFDPHYLMRNLASLFGIPASRMRVPKIVAGSTRRRLEAGTSAVGVDLVVDADDLCASIETCGPHGACSDGVCV